MVVGFLAYPCDGASCWRREYKEGTGGREQVSLSTQEGVCEGVTTYCAYYDIMCMCILTKGVGEAEGSDRKIQCARRRGHGGVSSKG